MREEGRIYGIKFSHLLITGVEWILGRERQSSPLSGPSPVWASSTTNGSGRLISLHSLFETEEEEGGGRPRVQCVSRRGWKWTCVWSDSKCKHNLKTRWQPVQLQPQLTHSYPRVACSCTQTIRWSALQPEGTFGLRPQPPTPPPRALHLQLMRQTGRLTRRRPLRGGSTNSRGSSITDGTYSSATSPATLLNRRVPTSFLRLSVRGCAWCRTRSSCQSWSNATRNDSNPVPRA